MERTGRAKDTAAVGCGFFSRMMRWLKPIKTALDPSLKKAVFRLPSSVFRLPSSRRGQGGGGVVGASAQSQNPFHPLAFFLALRATPLSVLCVVLCPPLAFNPPFAFSCFALWATPLSALCFVLRPTLAFPLPSPVSRLPVSPLSLLIRLSSPNPRNPRFRQEDGMKGIAPCFYIKFSTI